VKKKKHTTEEKPRATLETDLERNPHLFKQVLNASGVPMGLRDNQLRLTFPNRAFTDFYEYSTKELQEMRLVDLLPEKTLRLHIDTIKPTILGGNSWEGEYTIRTKRGRLCAVWGRFDPVTDASGTVTHAISIMQDASTSMRLRNALTQTERHLRFLAANTSDCLFRLRLTDGRFDYISSAAKSITGYTPQEFYNTPMSFQKLVPSDWTETFDLWWNEFLAGKNRHTYESPLLHKDGSLHWVNQRISIITDEKGQPVAIEGIASDITERKRDAEAIQKSESRFRTLFEDSPISLWEEDMTRLKIYFNELKAQGVTDFRKHFYSFPEDLAKCSTLVDVVDVNKATLDMLKARNKSDLLGNLDKVLTESSMEAFTEEMILLASGDYDYCGEITHRTLKGDIIWVMVHFSVPPEFRENLSRVIISLLDITPKKRAEEALLNSEERYRVLVENAQEGVVVTQNGFIKYINESMTGILGYSADELKQIHPLELAHPEDKAFALEQLSSLVTGKKKHGFASFRFITKNAQTKWLTFSVKPVVWEGFPAQLEILTDITIYKALEEELRTAHRDMENRIHDRTTQLSEANTRLKNEAKEREKAQEHIQSLTQQLIKIQEEERKRIARDLHDKVAQDLSSTVLQMETLFDGHPQTDTELFKRGSAIARVLKETIASVRDIAYGLRPPALDQLGLIKALENHCADTEDRIGITVDFYTAGIENIRLDLDTEINIYRMVQEAIRNVIKHANASKATVRLIKSHPDLLVRIEDNGHGFEIKKRLSEVAGEKRMGLHGMEERARLINGSMEIQSLIGTGTRIIFKIPLKKAQEARPTCK
jgi:PAS domain S-box-containing protein